MLVLTIVALFTIFFIVAFEQAGGLLALYAHSYTDRSFFGFVIPTAWFQSLNPFFIVLLAPMLSWVWTQFARNKKDLSMAVKVSLGFFLTSISFLFMMGAAMQFSAIGKSAALWLVVFNIFCTLGELCINPIVWSNVSKLAPARYISSMMAVILVCIGIGSYLSGVVGSFVDDLGPYQIFGGIAVVMALAGVVLLTLNKKLESMVHLQEAVTDEYIDDKDLEEKRQVVRSSAE
jgi:POT family proton-dependent oligopeptide transporter